MEIALPEKTVQELSEKTEASVTIKSDAAEVTLNKAAVDGLAAQAGDDGYVKLVVETVKQEPKLQEVEDMGYTLKYQYYRSIVMKKNYKAKFETLGKPYTNTDAKKGTRYYYKARIVVYDEEGSLVTKTDLKKCWYATRIR